MSSIAFFHLASVYPKATEKIVESARKFHPNKYYFLGVDNTFSYRDKIEFFREPIESSSLALFKYLSENIPASIYRSDSLIGCVHCSDLGVLYIEKFKNGKLHKWQIDTAHENMPLDMKSFTKLAMVVINKLNEDRLCFQLK